MAGSLTYAAAALLLPTLVVAEFTSLGANTACRKSTDPGQDCVESSSKNCADRYHVLTQIPLSGCKMVCETLGLTCMGLEYNHCGGSNGCRCEIWTNVIGGEKTATNFECFYSTGGMADSPLAVSFNLTVDDLDLSNTSLPAVSLVVDPMVKQHLPGLFPGLVSSTGITTEVYSIDEKLGFQVTVVPDSVGAAALQLYAALRQGSASDFHDGTVSKVTDVTNLIKTNFNAVVPLTADLDFKTGATGVTVTLEGRDIGTPPPTPSTTEASGTTRQRKRDSGARRGVGVPLPVLVLAALAAAAVSA